MSRRLPLSRGVLAACLFAGFFPVVRADAQTPMPEGFSAHTYAEGLDGPAAVALDAHGVLFVASYYDKYGSNMGDIYRIPPGGPAETFTSPIFDPDVLCLDASGAIYVGSYGGAITRVDPVSGSQSTWLSHWTLGNIDGMVFDSQGNLLISAIDNALIHRIAAGTKQVTVFADLSSLDYSGYGGLAIDPSDGSVFVTTPHDGFLVKLDENGQVVDTAFASGFAHMGQLSIRDGMLYASDNARGEIWRIRLSDGHKSLFVFGIEDLASGFVSSSDGSFYGTKMPDAMADGAVYRVAPLELSLQGTPGIGQTPVLHAHGDADSLRQGFLFFSIGDDGAPISDGRTIPINPLAFYGPLYVPFDSAGDFSFPFTIPSDPALIGVTFHTCALSAVPGPNGIKGISASLPVTVQ